MKNRKYNLLPYETIVKATAGEPEAGLSQILCNHREVVKNRVKILKGGSGASCCRLLYKITAVRGHVKGGGVSLHSSYPLICRQSAAQSGMRSAKNTAS